MDFHLFRLQILESQNKLAIKTEPLDELRSKDGNEIAFVLVKDEFEGAVGQCTYNSLEAPGSNVPVNRRRTADSKVKIKPVRKKAPTRPVRKRRISQSEPVVEESNGVPCTESTEIDPSSAEPRKYICDQCNRAFQRPSRFLAHYRSVHLKQFERKICPYCPRSFTMSSSCKLEFTISVIKTVHFRIRN